MTQEGQQSFIGVFVVPEIIPGASCPSEPLEGQSGRRNGHRGHWDRRVVSNTPSNRPDKGERYSLLDLVGALLRPNVESRRNSRTVILALRPELKRISRSKQSEDGLLQKKTGFVFWHKPAKAFSD